MKGSRKSRFFGHADTVVHSAFVAPPLGLTDALLFDERFDPPELFLDRSVECVRPQP
jgi:hypothetical protein